MMAAQCGVNNAPTMVHQSHHQFVSSSAYYGYVPVQHQEASKAAASVPLSADQGMDVDAVTDEGLYNQAKHQLQLQHHIEEERRRCLGPRKRVFVHDEVAAYIPRFKRFREEAQQAKGWSDEEKHNAARATIDKLSGFAFRGGGNKRLFNDAGDWYYTEGPRLAQVYHEPLLRLSPAADIDMACQATALTGNLKFQSAALSRNNNNVKSQELEDMLLLTHGCSSYHYYRQTNSSQASDYEEAEF